MNSLLCILIAAMVINCGGVNSSWDCSLAASPVSITIKNDGDKSEKLTLYQKSKTHGFERLGTLRIDAKSDKNICLEAESPLENGLYIYCDDKTYRVKINWQEDVELNLFDSTKLIENIPELEYLMDPKW